jgi:uncharacterized protein (TIGR02147 family)
MRIFDFLDYHQFLTEYMESLPHKGYGQLTKLAKALRANPSTVTLVLQGQKDFTPEQTYNLSEYLGLNDLEADYLLTLVNYKRAGTANLKAKLHRQLLSMKEQSQKLNVLMPPKKELSEEVRAIFYSQWYFSGIRILSSIDGFQNIERLAQRTQLPRAKVKQVVDFLVQNQLCSDANNEIKMGPMSTHIPAASPLVSRHHANWRQRSIASLDDIQEGEFFFTSPLSVKIKDSELIREILTKCVTDVFKIVDPSPCEEAYCFNIDWFKI